MSDRDARDGRPSDVIIGNQESARYVTQHPNLVAYVRQIRPSGGLDFTDDLESLGHGRMVLPVERRVPPELSEL